MMFKIDSIYRTILMPFFLFSSLYADNTMVHIILYQIQGESREHYLNRIKPFLPTGRTYLLARRNAGLISFARQHQRITLADQDIKEAANVPNYIPSLQELALEKLLSETPLEHIPEPYKSSAEWYLKLKEAICLQEKGE